VKVARHVDDSELANQVGTAMRKSPSAQRMLEGIALGLSSHGNDPRVMGMTPEEVAGCTTTACAACGCGKVTPAKEN
jgi:hypothetical protein